MSRYDTAADSFTFKDEGDTPLLGLLLPAVQAAEEEPEIDSFFAGRDESQIALLLPAVQSAREAVRATTCQNGDEMVDEFAAEPDYADMPITLIELLEV
jgi:hypothetical protein